MDDVAIYAIDFGTSNSLLAAAGKRGAHAPLALDPSAREPTILRSILFFSEDARWSFGVEALRNFVAPELDIVAYFARSEPPTASLISRRSQMLFDGAMHHPTHPLFLALFKVASEEFRKVHPAIEADAKEVTILRSVLMKPEHLAFVPQMVRELEEIAGV